MTRSSFAVCATIIAACAAEPPVETPPDAALEPAAPAQPLALPACTPDVCTAGTCGMHDDGCGGVLWCGPCACPTSFETCEIETPVIAEVALMLSPGETLTVTTSNLSSGADSVLHLLDNTGAQLAISDDAPGLGVASRIVYTPSSLGQHFVRIVARAKSASTTGTATLTYRTVSQSIALSYDDVAIASSRAGDRLETVGLPGAAASHVVYAMNGGSITARGVTNGLGNATLGLPSSGTTHYLIGRVGTTGAATPARLLRNDVAIAGHDTDNDGLGNDLEAALGTCSTQTGTATGPDGVTYACGNSADPRDTDGDGLHDDWEVRGRLDVSPGLPLTRWGADPRHKDIFVEVDYGRTTAGETETKIAHDDLVLWAAFFADRISTLSTATRLAHAVSIQNPDFQVGVRVHVDAGVAPASPAWVALYGDWGGHDVIDPVDDGNGGTTLINYRTSRDQHMSTSRRGVFRYGLKVIGAGGGQTSSDNLASTYSGGGHTLAHETGHTAQLTHDGRTNSTAYVNCKPNYPSIMNYAYGDAVGFSDGNGAPALNNARLAETGVADPVYQATFLQTMQSTFGYHVDLAAGSVDWNYDGVFAPAGETVEAYANFHAGAECEFTREGMTKPAGPYTTTISPALAHFGGRTFVFSGAAGTLHWTYTTSGLHCRVPHGTCASFSTSGSIAGLGSDRGVDALTLPAGDKVLLVGLDASHAWHWATITGWSLSQPIVSSVKTFPVEDLQDEPTLALDGATPTLFYRDATGALFKRSYIASADAWSTATPLLDGNGNPVRMALLGSLGATMAPPLDLSTTQSVMTLVFGAPSTGCMQMWHRSPTTARWVNDAANMPSCVHVVGRPAIAFVPDPDLATYAGRLHIVYMPGYHPSGQDPARQLTSVAWPASKMAQSAFYDNEWMDVFGIDLLFDPAFDDDLRAAFAVGGDPDRHGSDYQHLRFDPKADGITDFTYTDYDDWRTMRTGICATIEHDSSVTDPVICPWAP
ncbi:MAG TPA: hypothetical protein VL463_28860 [Kofleriaceae bacterium]|nr:hypothetical protein [Kofleriaceae bacterium]